MHLDTFTIHFEIGSFIEGMSYAHVLSNIWSTPNSEFARGYFVLSGFLDKIKRIPVLWIWNLPAIISKIYQENIPFWS
jgi:hypothetical protein